MTDEKKPPGIEQAHQYTKREAETQMVLGIFLSVIAIPVLIGTFWAETGRAMVVNAVAGVVLLAIGIGLAIWGRVTSKKVQSSAGESHDQIP